VKNKIVQCKCCFENSYLVKRNVRCIISEFHEVQVIFKDESILIQSLKDIGYAVEVHENGTSVGNSYSKGYKGNSHVVVRKNQFNGMGDIGFEKTAKGFIMHADDYDSGKHGKRFKLNNLNKKYVENKLKKYVSNTSNCNIFSRKENSQGQLEIQLRLTD